MKTSRRDKRREVYLCSIPGVSAPRFRWWFRFYLPLRRHIPFRMDNRLRLHFRPGRLRSENRPLHRMRRMMLLYPLTVMQNPATDRVVFRQKKTMPPKCGAERRMFGNSRPAAPHPAGEPRAACDQEASLPEYLVDTGDTGRPVMVAQECPPEARSGREPAPMGVYPL